MSDIEEDKRYILEFLANDLHWCRLTGGPIEKMGMLVQVPKTTNLICIPHITEKPILESLQDIDWSIKSDGGETTSIYKKLYYHRNPVNRTQFDFQG